MRLTKTTVLSAAMVLLTLSAAQASPLTLPGTVEALFLDAGGGHQVEFDVDANGAVTCQGAAADCVVFNLPGGGLINPHDTLVATTKLGMTFNGFAVGAVGAGGASVFPPTLVDLTQRNVLTLVGAPSGVFTTGFFDTHYCGGAGFGACFGTTFRLSETNNPDINEDAAGTTTRYAGFVDPVNAFSTGTPINLGGTVIVGLGVTAGTFVNPIGGPSGSLSLITQTIFPVRGSVFTFFTVSTRGTFVPEPSTFAMFGIVGGFAAFKLRRRKV